MNSSLQAMISAWAVTVALSAAALFAPVSWASAADDVDLVLLEEQAIKQAVSRVAPSVVRIETLGGLETVGDVLIGTGPTTGLVVSSDGYIVSSAFNFAQKPASILVTLPGGKRVAAKLVATDHSRMIVLLKVDVETPLAVPEAAARAEMTVGQWAIALGRTFEGELPNISVGIVSALDRIWGKAVQTDAKVSPNNYGGPLIDVHGRVLGVLAPLSPQASDEVAGVEWYDSGIGFAVPLEHLNTVLPKLTDGQDLHPGLMGLSLRGADLFAEGVVIAAVHPSSPAYQAGFKPEDSVVEIAGQKINRQADLKQQIAGRYAGDKVRLAVLRGGKRVEGELELVAKLAPYEAPFLGILPLRDSQGFVVRYVYADSPAAKAGIEPGDKLNSIGGTPVVNRAALLELLAALAPGEKAIVEIKRGEKSQTMELQLAALPEAVPPQLPPARKAASTPADKLAGAGPVQLKIPEFANQALAYIPETYDAAIPHGLVVWLHGAGGVDDRQLVDRWQAICRQHDLILLAPQSADPAKWQRTELDFVRKAIDEVIAKYNIDRTRVVAHGEEAGGAMAYLLAFAHRDLVRGLAPVESPLPVIAQPPDNDPVLRLAVYAALTAKSPMAANIQAGVKRLRDMKYAVSLKELGGSSPRMNADELAELARWIDSLDRI